MATHFVPTEEIQKLTLGSYEFLASKIDDAISKDAKKVFGESVPNKIERIGTFGEHVLVAADDGRFMKVKYERATNGAVKIIAVEAVEVPLYTEDTLGSYLMKEARSIVDSLLAHDVAQAELKLRSLTPFIEETVAPTEAEIVASAIESVRAERPWKRLYRERSEQVSLFLGSELKGIEERKLPAKFSKLNDGNVPEDQHESYKDLVHTDLAYMAEALGSWHKLVETAGSFTEVGTVSAGDQAVVTTFLAFAEDLKLDLQGVRDSVLETARLVQSVPKLGELYDALAAESFHYEVASRFASAMIEGLRNSK